MPENKELLLLNRWVDGPFRTSHHPMCIPFTGHTLRLFGKDVCRGCLFWYPGILLGLLIGLIFQVFLIDPINLVIFLFLLISPTLLQLLISIPRPIKDIARLSLGLSTGFTLLVVLFPGQQIIEVRIFALASFLFFYIPLTYVRNNRNEEICQNCPEFSERSESKCSGYKIRRERAAIANTQLKVGITDVNEVNIKVSSFEDI
jgi:hypothetical protein